MIAKGLDFANVTLVGVLNGDATLNIPDFRSAERTYQLLNQVSCRSGRGEKLGEVVIQTFNTEHYSIVKSSQNDYEGFYVYYCNKYDILIMLKSEISEPYVKYARKGYIFDNLKIYTYIIYKGNFYYTTHSERIACQRIFRLLKK